MNFEKLKELEEQILGLEEIEQVYLTGYCKGLTGDIK